MFAVHDYSFHHFFIFRVLILLVIATSGYKSNKYQERENLNTDSFDLFHELLILI